MKHILPIVVVLFFATPAWAACGGSSPNLVAASNSRADVNDCITAAVDGDTITIPKGTGTVSWLTGTAISGKGIKIVGPGAGRIQARSATSITVGTGSKVFTIDRFTRHNGTPFTCADITGTIRATVVYDGTNFLDGSVTSCTGSTLTMNVASATGTGTHDVWVFSTPPELTMSIDAAVTAFAVTEDATHSTEISGIKFTSNTSGAIAVWMGYLTGGKPIVVHDCWWSSANNGATFIFLDSRRGVVYNTSIDGGFDSTSSLSSLGIHASWTGADAAASWATASTFGSADTSGDANFYVEDSDFHSMNPSNAYDFDNNIRVVVRYNLFDNAAGATHSQDSSLYGLRHWEFYNNTFAYDVHNDARDFNLPNGWFYIRGGTGIWTDNTIGNIISSWWGGDRAEINMTLQQLRRNAGCDACYSGAVPASRQVGYGYVDGSGGTNATCESAAPNAGAGYKGDIEPFYLWNNTGSLLLGLSDFSPDECAGGPAVSSYIRNGTEYVVGTAKPGYTKGVYPHPLQGTQTLTMPRGRPVTP